MIEKEKLNNIVLNENAYFFHRNKGTRFLV